MEPIDRLRAICLALPEAHEEPAWTGTRWRVRTKTFAHVIEVDEGSPPSLAKVRDVVPLPATVVTFRSTGEELAALRAAGHPFCYVGFGRDAMAMALDDRTDWDEVRELLTESYCLLAPQKLRALVVRPGG